MATNKTEIGPDLTAHVTARTKWYSGLDDSARLAVNELYTFLNDTIANNRSRKTEVVSEANEFERQYAGFFAVAASFIVAGLLSARPDNSATQACKVFYFAALVSALLAALSLLVESIILQKFFGKWQKINDQIGEYISKGDWHSPNELNEWIGAKEAKEPKRSTTKLAYVMLGLVGVAFIFMICWQVEVLFNPDWLLINPIH
jgi:Na+(H+)/acetate symporter ActP